MAGAKGGSVGGTNCISVSPLQIQGTYPPPCAPDLQHELSYDDCLEDNEGRLSELFCAVL